ncbi:ThiF family adenylyltransferase [Neorhizobium galegae]|uniref:Bacteriocin biosynthesis protein n=1 Tax=Neorhizobium galegae bv. orientalis str. HAMBI 540 TaxID=1028800 RepID=A0A068SZJ0_NEOGA|nr:ThiF family adenylyltransferase [Neorhizobium galegae]CDN51259.1 Bacteriocin biosynthesis protein [Neorhizobium galegae bv. orientalis str. HAMBI 540]
MKAFEYHADLFDVIHETDFVIVGCGGLGSQIASQLAALGARNFFLVDGDRIEENSQNRRSRATAEDTGRLKSDRLATYLASRFSAAVAIMTQFADGAEAARLTLARTRKPFLILAEDDGSLVRQFLAEYHATAPAPLPYLHVGQLGPFCVAGPLVALPDDACPFCCSTLPASVDTGDVAQPSPADNALIACFAVSQIAIERLTHRSSLRGHRWLFAPATGHASLHPVSKSHDCKVCQP